MDTNLNIEILKEGILDNKDIEKNTKDEINNVKVDDPALIHKDNDNSDKNTKIKIPKHGLPVNEQTFFTLFGKKRRFPGKDDSNGFYSTLYMILIPTVATFVLSLICIIYIKCKNEYKQKAKINLNLLIVLCVIMILTLIIDEWSLFDITTSIPGYQKTNKMTEEEFNASKPTITIQNKTFILKYCPTCGIVRDVRTFHCDTCGACVLVHDHHCGFTSNCIGKYNLKIFYCFLWITLIHGLYVTAVGACIIVINIDIEKDTLLTIMAIFIGIILMYIMFFLMFVFTMICSHTCLISSGTTTNEDIRNKYDYKVFNKGCRNNWKEVFCSKEVELIDI